MDIYVLLSRWSLVVPGKEIVQAIAEYGGTAEPYTCFRIIVRDLMLAGF